MLISVQLRPLVNCLFKAIYFNAYMVYCVFFSFAWFRCNHKPQFVVTCMSHSEPQAHTLFFLPASEVREGNEMCLFMVCNKLQFAILSNKGTMALCPTVVYTNHNWFIQAPTRICVVTTLCTTALHLCVAISCMNL